MPNTTRRRRKCTKLRRKVRRSRRRSRKLFNKLKRRPLKYIRRDLFKNTVKERVVSDFIAGMTDRFAINLNKSIK